MAVYGDGEDRDCDHDDVRSMLACDCSHGVLERDGACTHDLAELAAMRDGNRDAPASDETLIVELRRAGVCARCIVKTFGLEDA